MADLSIDAANKIRLSMGLPALPGGSAPTTGPAFKPAKDAGDSDEEPASTVDTRQAAAYDNWKALQDEAEAKKKREDRTAAIKKERERAARFAKLEGKGLADEANEDDDMAWLKSSKKRQKKIAKAEQTLKDQEERERQAREAMQYTEADLAGVKVGHEVDQFDDEDQILVLKDTAVDGEDEDELEAVALRDQERLQERLDSKKRKRAYDPNDMDESGQKSILAQYDEEIDGKKGKIFTLDGKGRTVEDTLPDAPASRSKKVAISLDMLQDDAPANDYMDYSEIKMKKPKKKKAKKSKRERVEDEEELLAVPAEPVADDMEVDEDEAAAPKPKKKSVFDESFIDDDDLQANLAAQRQKALKKRKKMRPEDIARQLREEASAPGTPDVMETTEESEDAALIIDETTEFVQNLGANVAGGDAEESRRKSSLPVNGTKSMGNSPAADEDGDVDMGQSYAEAAEAEDARKRSVSRTRDTGITDTGLEAEKTVDQGLGATLALLRQRGLVTGTDTGDKNASYRDRQKFLADKLKAEADAERSRKTARERERGSARWNTMTPREREEWARKQNTNADMSESRRLADIFNKEYKPNVELTYVDEHGRSMNQKEAFKQLSHQFHGKGSGNTKTKKYLDKVEQEKKKMAESSLEAGHGGIGNAQDQQAKKLKTAGVRLQ
jgi:U4/U6.U5 tri-snRNP-associated protein 1